MIFLSTAGTTPHYLGFLTSFSFVTPSLLRTIALVSKLPFQITLPSCYSLTIAAQITTDRTWIPIPYNHSPTASLTRPIQITLCAKSILKTASFYKVILAASQKPLHQLPSSKTTSNNHYNPTNPYHNPIPIPINKNSSTSTSTYIHLQQRKQHTSPVPKTQSANPKPHHTAHTTHHHPTTNIPAKTLVSVHQSHHSSIETPPARQGSYKQGKSLRS